MNLPPAIKELWKDKPLLITAVVGVGILLYVLYKSNKSNLVAPTDTTGAGTTGGGGTYSTVEINAPTYNTTSAPPIPLPVPVTTTSAPPPASVATVPHTPGEAAKVPKTPGGKVTTSGGHPTSSVATSTPKKASPGTVAPTTNTKKATVQPAPKGSLKVGGAGNGDTNFSILTVPGGIVTLATVAQIARFGSDSNPDWKKLVSYRNNKAILQSAGVNINSPAAIVPQGTKLSI